MNTIQIQRLLILTGLVLTGCAGGGNALPPLQPAATEVSSVTPAAASAQSADGSATEVYSRIALGAVNCWFGGSGPLKKEYIYHAEADAASRGGRAQIVVHERDPTQPNPRGPKAYKITIEPTGDASSSVQTENLKMPDAFGAAMAADVGRWSKGDQGCAGSSTVVGWSPNADPSAAEAIQTKKPASKKAKPKAAQATPAAKKPAQ